MVYDEKLANRIQNIIQRRKGFTQKKMFGGISFLINGKMCCGVIKNDLVVRVNPGSYEKLITEKHVRPMDFTGRPMKGFVYVGPNGCKSTKMIARWVNLSVNYVNSFRGKK